MSLTEITAKIGRFILGQHQFKGTVLTIEHARVGSFELPVTLYGIRIQGEGSLMRLCEEGHTGRFNFGDSIAGYYSKEIGAYNDRTSWYKLIEIEKVESC